MKLRAVNEWDALRAVVVGTAHSMGGTPLARDAYDPKSKEHILAGTFPLEKDCTHELDALTYLLEARDIQVFRPESIDNLNQIFARDIGVVIDDRFVVTRVISERAAEWEGIAPLLHHVRDSHLLTPPQGVRMEGGDIMPMNGEIWIGYSAEDDFARFTTSRTNEAALDWLSDQYQDWNIRGFELTKSDDDPRKNALHLDCCLSIMSDGHAIFHPEGLKQECDRNFIRQTFDGKLLEVDANQMYDMQCNLISITSKDVVSCPTFQDVNNQLQAWGYDLHTTILQETAKMEGLLRCVTLPLMRQV